LTFFTAYTKISLPFVWGTINTGVHRTTQSGPSFLILEASRSNRTTHHRWNSSGRVISWSQGLISDNTPD